MLLKIEKSQKTELMLTALLKSSKKSQKSQVTNLMLNVKSKKKSQDTICVELFNV